MEETCIIHEKLLNIVLFNNTPQERKEEKDGGCEKSVKAE